MARWMKALVVVGAVLLTAGFAVLGLRLATQTVTGAKDTIPTEYRTLLLSAAERCPQLPASVLAAQIATESGWDPAAESPAGAQGIAQFIPQTWEDYGLDASGDGRTDVYDPQDAIPSAAELMCRMFKETRRVPGDRINLALAAYNAGPSQVRQYGGVPPFRETEQYVQRVRQRAATEPFAALDR